ncbi:hypothetical protein EJ08DRAFT_697798 [Tothia fuscella]|uniref:Uncharacterized protein n=1 Tax=Tothia fuscella TaxID=1048955 RepID=A0A9P4NQW2_9PEZI|nr:hypothetical protein EJ08DRAFT_697798 [Tothia fuscella]
MLYSIPTIAAFASLAAAQRPNGTSICDYYTTALLKNNTAVNQMTLLTLLVNTAVIGNYTKPNVGITVPGILAKGKVNETEVDLLPYFIGGLVSSNRGNKAVSVNFLDDGGAVPLTLNKAANGTNSAQYRLLTHLYEYFGGLLGCSLQGQDGYPKYAGSNNMGSVHKFMGLSHAEVTYFITQVGLSAASFGVTTEDVTAVGTALNEAFGYICSPPASIPASEPKEPQAICQADDCPLAANAQCSAYDKVVEPATATSSAVATGSATKVAGQSGGPMATSGAEVGKEVGGVMGVVAAAGVFAMVL